MASGYATSESQPSRVVPQQVLVPCWLENCDVAGGWQWHYQFRPHRPTGGSHCDKDPETEPKLINTSHATDDFAWPRYDTIHDNYDETIDVDNDSLVVKGHKIALPHKLDLL